MRINRWLMVGAIASLLVGVTAWAVVTQKTFRTTMFSLTVFQSKGPSGAPAYGFFGAEGHDLVNLVLGTPLSTVRSNQVLALEVPCDSNSVSLVVFDKTTSNNIATIATSTSMDVVKQQGADSTKPFPSGERFVATLEVNPANHLLGGFLTIAGRLHLDPATGCPVAVVTALDKDKLDKNLTDFDVTSKNDKDPGDKLGLRAGRAHGVGVLDVVFDDGTTNTMQLPYVAFSIQRKLSSQ